MDDVACFVQHGVGVAVSTGGHVLDLIQTHWPEPGQPWHAVALRSLAELYGCVLTVEPSC